MASPASSPYLRQTLLKRLADARGQTDRLFPLVSPNAIYDRTIPERHRLIFYLGHLEAFDWNLFAGVCGLKPFNPVFDKLFSFGIDPVDGNLPSDQPSDWPARYVIEAYNADVRAKLDALLASPLASDTSLPALADGTLIQVAIEHRLMHAETLAYLLHQLPFNRKIARNEPLLTTTPPFEPQLLTIPEGGATLGQSSTAGGFGWDNEFEAELVRVPEFRIDAYPITNGQFLAFLRAGGYGDRSLWSEPDWEWKSAQEVLHPEHWTRRGDEWHYRAMFAEIPLPLAWPVYVSHAEASAYARWTGKPLPTEAQWHRAAYGTADVAERPYPWGSEPPAAQHGNFDLRRWDPEPVNAHPAGASAFGVFDLLGNGWEWTRTHFGPLPGFQAFPFYPGYSANFFDGKHFVMKGGSPRTATCMLRRPFRNWFQPHYPFVYATFRCVED
jgi:iron(II)-dependent oxidoreductase